MSGRGNECGMALASLDGLRRTKILEDLLVSRLLRKSARVKEVWEECHRDWNETLYRMTAYAMGAPRNSVPFETLARRVTLLMCLKEQSSRRRVEAMMLGAADMLRGEHYDDYMVALHNEYEYLRSKYEIKGMHNTEWNRGGNLPAGSPMVRVVQMSALVSKLNYSMDSLLKIKTMEQVKEFFTIDVGEYWSRRLGTEARSGGAIGMDKIAMLAINLVVPLQFAYADVVKKDEGKYDALELLDSVAAERNRLVSRWTGYGVVCKSGYDSQALIELSHLCDEGKCIQCPLGREMPKASGGDVKVTP